MVNYLGCYAPALADLQPLLDKLNEKDTAWKWDPEQQWDKECYQYSNIKCELLAVAFYTQETILLYCRIQRKVGTDHEPLTSMLKKLILSTSARIQMLSRLLQCDIDIHNLPGKNNLIADTLSRVSPL